MTDPEATSDADERLVRSLCEEALHLATKVTGSLTRLSVRAGDAVVEMEWSATSVVAAPAGTAAAAPAPHQPADTVDDAATGRSAIVAPLLGTFYRSPEPGARPFVEEGDVVEAGQVVAIIEAMKLMNQIEADRGGRVAQILVGDGEMVEFGQELILLEPVDGA